MHEGRSGQSSATLTLADVAETRQPSTACRSTPRLELIEELVYGVVCVRRDFSRIRRQIGKLSGSQMSLIGAEACRMYAACALGLCVAGLRGQLRKLPFGVSACYAGLSPSRGSSWLGGLFWELVSRSQILSEDPLYGVVNGRVCKRRGEHFAACRRTPPRRLPTSACAGGPSTASRSAVGVAPAPTPLSATGPGPAPPHGGLGSREGFAPRRLRRDSVQRASIFV